MPTLPIIDGVRITMYYADHEPAHFHAIAGGDEIVVGIADLRVIAVAAPPAIVRRVRTWARRGQGELALCWNPLPRRAEAGKDRGMKLRTIQSAKALPASRIRLVWHDGSDSVVDLAPVLAKGGVFAFLTDPAAFGAVTVGARGRTLVWRHPDGDEIDLCADALSRLAHEGAIEAA